MNPGSGAAGADKFLVDYRHAHLMLLRARLVDNSETGVTKVLLEYRRKLDAPVQKYIKGLPISEQP